MFVPVWVTFLTLKAPLLCKQVRLPWSALLLWFPCSKTVTSIPLAPHPCRTRTSLSARPPIDLEMRHPCSWLFLATAAWWLGGGLARAQGTAKDGSAPEFTILSPAQGAVLSPGVIHFNYTLSHCPPSAFVTIEMDGENVFGDNAFFWCQEFIWHGIQYISLGNHSVMWIIWEGNPMRIEGRVALGSAHTYFTVLPDHGRFFGVRDVTIVDAAPTAAYFRAPANHTSVLLGADGSLSLRHVPSPAAVVAPCSRLCPGRHVCPKGSAARLMLAWSPRQACGAELRPGHRRVFLPRHGAVQRHPPDARPCHALMRASRAADSSTARVSLPQTMHRSRARREACPSACPPGWNAPRGRPARVTTAPPLLAAAGEEVETRAHEVLVQLPEGRHCFEVRATVADAAAVLREIKPPVRRE